MFKAASIFKIKFPGNKTTGLLADVIESGAEICTFCPCGAIQETSVGWVPPRGHEHGPLVTVMGYNLIMRLAIETKSVPAQALRDAVEAKVKEIEDITGRKPGKKERRELTEDTKMSMLPMAFATRSNTWVWIDSESGLLVIDSASQARTDEVVSQLVRLIDGVVVQHLVTQTSPQSIMTSWLHDRDLLSSEDRFNFDIGRACELKACDESKAVVRYSRHSLDTEEVKNHILAGKMATKLALTYNDRVSFTLTDGGTLTGIKFIGAVFENAAAGDGKADHFDANVVIMTGELSNLIQDLIDALGGEVAEGGAV